MTKSIIIKKYVAYNFNHEKGEKPLINKYFSPFYAIFYKLPTAGLEQKPNAGNAHRKEISGALTWGV